MTTDRPGGAAESDSGARPVVGVVGLGVMGGAMGANLAAAGFDLVGHDIDPDQSAAFAGRALRSVTEVADRAEVILLSLPSAGALDEVSNRLAATAPTGAVVVEMGTFPLAAKEAARQRLASAGVALLDAPVSGTGLQATDATLVVYSSGDEVSHRRALPVFDVIGSTAHFLGPFGNGSRMKYLANLLVAVQTLAAAEAHALGAASGLDAGIVQEVIASGVGTSAMFEIRGPLMVDGRYDPPAARLDIILKDTTIIADHARSVDVATPLLDRALSVFRAGSEAGHGDLDAAAVRLLFDESPEVLDPLGSPQHRRVT